MDARDRHAAIDWANVAAGMAAMLLAVAALIFVLWLVLSTPKTKLFEADNVVCASQPFTMQCWHR
jgi:lysophospholipid acyltransferase (LPLAT)-like uncharacterized protein